MIYDLFALLNEKTFSHPSTVAAAQMADDTLRLTVRGCGWWKTQPTWTNGDAILSFTGISHGKLGVPALVDPEDDEALGDFEIIRSDDLDWAQPVTFLIYCSQPLPEPLALYDVVERWVERSSGIKAVHDFLHGATRLSTFLTYSNTSFYMLAQGPESLRPLLANELTRQNVRHQFEAGHGCSESRYLVRLAAGTWFFCESATLEEI
ncbi:MAG: hypothetical protein H2038_08160 [Brevundimonas sp.]|uniref:hypothetical protein n=1 Tax=Brevundimonas sp. TaxID=1871086 RepID=UPI0017FFEEEE|nr:hypothetical protein [Brevundimonas sp.]MBA4804605.1 hypothetical protein [Brevundimonas sp.]